MSGHVPEKLSTFLKDKYDIDTFVETGTYKGATTKWAAENFARVFTIEAYKKYYQQAKKALSKYEHVECLLGDSRELLGRVLAVLQKPAVIWLDAHWIGDAKLAHEQKDECPLIEELIVVQTSGLKHFVLIDDARLFLAPPKKPHDPEQWPTITAISQLLAGYVLKVKNDIIIAMPKDTANAVSKFIDKHDIR